MRLTENQVVVNVNQRWSNYDMIERWLTFEKNSVFIFVLIKREFFKNQNPKKSVLIRSSDDVSMELKTKSIIFFRASVVQFIVALHTM